MRFRAKKGAPIAWLREHIDYQSDDCLIWPFSTSAGYGQVWHEGQHWRAHRLMCVLAHGPATAIDMHAAHSCGKGHEGCVNPVHLEWKTLQANVLDRVRHRRERKPTQQSQKLSEADVLEIRSLRGAMANKVLAVRFGVSAQTITNIQRRRTWRNGADRRNGTMFQRAFDIVTEEVSKERTGWSGSDVERLVYRIFDSLRELTPTVTQRVPDRFATMPQRDMLDLWRSMVIAVSEDR